MGHMIDHINQGYDELASKLDKLPKTIFPVLREIDELLKPLYRKDKISEYRRVQLRAIKQAREIIRKHTEL